MLTTSQVAKRANVSQNTIRNHVRDFAPLFSISARGENGPRLFNEDDTETACAIAALRRSGVPPSQIIDAVRNGQAPPVIDVTATVLQDPSNSLQTTQDSTTALQIVSNALQDRLNGIETRLLAHETEQRRLSRNWVWWHRAEGVIVGIAVCTFVIWLFYLLTDF